jgi:hypothetical protein
MTTTQPAHPAMVEDPPRQEQPGPQPHIVDQVFAWLWRHRLVLVLLAISAVYFLYNYVASPLKPGNFTPLGWHGWADQGHYLEEAKAIREWDLEHSVRYQYPMGYPLAGAPFVHLFPGDPFLPVNLASFLGVVGLFFATAYRWVGKPMALIGGLLLVLATPLTLLTFVPWTSTIAVLTVTFWLYLVLGRQRITYPMALILALLVSWMYMARGGGELVMLAPLGIATVWHFRREPGLIIKVAMAAAILAATVVLNAVWTHALFHQWVHPYIRAVGKVGFSAHHIPRSLWGTVIYTGETGDWWPPLGTQAFWFVFAPFGMWLAVRRRDADLHVGYVLSLAVGVLITAAFANFDPTGVKFYCLHYLKLWFPGVALYSMIAIRRLLDATPPGGLPRR